MTEADTSVESLAQRLAAEGRDALVERLRGAYADAAAAHSDIVRLDDVRIEQMVQDAADRADGLQWRRALATVASQELGIELSTALSHPAVARAQRLVGAPSYENSLAELVGQKYTPLPALGADAAGPVAGPHSGEPASIAVAEELPEAAPPSPTSTGIPPSQADFGHAGEVVIEEPEPLDADAADDEFLPPPTPLRPVAPTPPLPAPPPPATPSAPTAPLVPAASDAAPPAADLAGGAYRPAPSADETESGEANTAVHQLPPPAAAPAGDENQPPKPTHTIGGGGPKRPSYGPAADLQASNVTPLHGPPPSTEEHGFDGAEHDLDIDLGHPTAAWDAHTEDSWVEEDGYEDHELESPGDDLGADALAVEHDGELRVSAFHLGGVANLPTGKEQIDVLLSANGLDILRPSGEIVGRLGWAEIETLEVPMPRGRRRRRANRDRAELVVRTRHGDASFEVPGFSPEELQETVEPAMEHFNRLTPPSF